MIKSSNLSLLSYVTPRSRTQYALGNGLAFRVYVNNGLWRPRWSTEHLETLTRSCHTWDHPSSFNRADAKWLLRLSPGVKSSENSMSQYNLTSSAKSLQVEGLSIISTISMTDLPRCHRLVLFVDRLFFGSIFCIWTLSEPCPSQIALFSCRLTWG